MGGGSVSTHPGPPSVGLAPTPLPEIPSALRPPPPPHKHPQPLTLLPGWRPTQHHTEGCTLWVCPVVEPRCRHHQAPHLLPLMGGTLALVNPQPSKTQHESDPEAPSALKMNKDSVSEPDVPAEERRTRHGQHRQRGPRGRGKLRAASRVLTGGSTWHPLLHNPDHRIAKLAAAPCANICGQETVCVTKRVLVGDVAGWTQEAPQSLQERTSRCLGARRCPTQEAFLRKEKYVSQTPTFRKTSLPYA